LPSKGWKNLFGGGLDLTYSSTLERSSKYHVISIAKKTLLTQYIGSELSNKASIAYKLEQENP
jgi:hypothetical protein